ncbi:MAG TPA: bacillithiol biosynthesis cysteine-adding enzyme BshC [Bacteroidetes bacterium]|nr:bacillithiol biosynthesis cysteine-adding enzyme BshC [Bacteroidota bacterium]
MQVYKISYDKVPQFSGRDRAYVLRHPALRSFYKYPPEWGAFGQVIADKQKEPVDRNTLVKVIWEQHKGLEVPALVAKNIEKLRNDNTFTIITAHQPALFTGPLYYIFKIISTISLTRTLGEKYPQYHFVPVFISSGEDHDFEEINHLHLFNKTLTWHHEQKGPVGQMDTATLRPVLDELKTILGESERAKAIFKIIEKTHTGDHPYGRAAFELAFHLFREEGLVVVNTYDDQLKRLFAPIVKEEILSQASKPLVEATIGRLKEAGFAPQATPRDINFFYLGEHLRERIVWENDAYRVLNTDLVFSKKEMEQEIDAHPERFSPNVIMRPLYQELVFPNLAYVGGGGEIAYWLERKDQFEHFGINFPMLVRRDSGLWIDAATNKKIKRVHLHVNDLWKDTDRLIREYLFKYGEVEISLQKERDSLQSIFRPLAEKAKAIDPGLEKMVLAELAKTNKSLDLIETRLLRAEKRVHESAVRQIGRIKEKLFPGNGLQERYDNFLPFYLKYGKDFFNTLLEHFNPLDKQFKIFVEE